MNKDNIYKYVIENNLVDVRKDGRVFKRYKDGSMKEAPQHSTSRDKKYKAISLYKDGKQHHLYVHRLVAFKYIPNPENKPQINHIDGNGHNNNVNNIEWATNSENIQHAHDSGLIDINNYGNDCKYCGEKTKAKDSVCTKCKGKIAAHNLRQKVVARKRRKVENIDLKPLDLRQRKAVYGRYMGKTYREIGEELGVSKQYVEQIISSLK